MEAFAYAPLAADVADVGAVAPVVAPIVAPVVAVIDVFHAIELR